MLHHRRDEVARRRASGDGQAAGGGYGFKISWIGFYGKGKTSALEMVGLKDTEEPDEVNEAPFSGAEMRCRRGTSQG